MNAKLSLLATMFLAAPACTDWRVQWLPPAKVLERESPSRLRAVMIDSSRIELTSPRVSNDSLFGRLRPDGLPWSSPLANVAYVVLPRSDVGATFVVASLVLGVVGTLAGVAVYASSFQ